METIFLDRNISEIQKKLRVPTFPPQTCHFCNEPITKLSGQVSESLCNHHISYEPEIVVISHLGCHTKYHRTHPDHPANPETEYRKKFTKNLGEDILCYFCEEGITKLGKESDSLLLHSLDGNHYNWDFANKVPSHIGCHTSFHQKGISRTEEFKRQKSDAWMGDKNPMRSPKAADKIRGENNPMANPIHRAKHLAAVRTPENRARAGKQWVGDKHPLKDPKIREKRKRTMNDPKVQEKLKESHRNAWILRRKKWPPNGIKPKEVE